MTFKMKFQNKFKIYNQNFFDAKNDTNFKNRKHVISFSNRSNQTNPSFKNINFLNHFHLLLNSFTFFFLFSNKKQTKQKASVSKKERQRKNFQKTKKAKKPQEKK
jgi:hypothetical protein